MISGNECTAECTVDYAKPTSGNICSTTCAYRLEGDSKICTSTGTLCDKSTAYKYTLEIDDSNRRVCSISCEFYRVIDNENRC